MDPEPLVGILADYAFEDGVDTAAVQAQSAGSADEAKLPVGSARWLGFTTVAAAVSGLAPQALDFRCPIYPQAP